MLRAGECRLFSFPHFFQLRVITLFLLQLFI
ncbi:Uncharacterised protein [Vibrio cholerae]|nr:Uncharacterised protein [Vibrio cholerae]